MSNTWFQFKQFRINQASAAMKVTTDACLFGAWAATEIAKREMEKIDYRILDIGAGTGLLGLMIAQQSKAGIDSIELDPAAAAEAEANYATSPWHSRLNIAKGDARDMADVPGKTYNTIISNPPFYENELAGNDPRRNQAHHDLGLRLPELFSIITGLLDTDGRFYLLLPYKRLSEIDALLIKYELELTKRVMVRQSTQHNFFRIMLEGKRVKDRIEDFTETEMAIKDGNEYTAEFVRLLKDYYLYL
jgi:tRNA1Val (adenine37-N6)-methyltransferase